MHLPKQRNDQDALIQYDTEKVEDEERQLQIAHCIWHVAWVERRRPTPFTIRRPRRTLSI